MLVMYLEEPAEKCDFIMNGKLPENNLPDYKGDIIADHYLPWVEYDGYWRKIGLIFSSEDDCGGN